MPSYRVGGGIEGAASTLLEHVQRQTKRREDEEDAQREWHRTVQKIVFSNPEKYNEQFVQALISGQATGPADWLQQQQRQIDQRLPASPFVAGPGGGIIGSATGEGEVAPGYAIPRPEVVNRLTPSLFRKPTKPLYQVDATGRPVFVGDLPENATLLRQPLDPLTDFLSSQGLGGTETEIAGGFPGQSADEEMVRVLDPGDGQIKLIPRSRLQEALRRGGQLVQ